MFCLRDVTRTPDKRHLPIRTNNGVRPIGLLAGAPLFGLLSLIALFLFVPLDSGAQCSGGTGGGGPTINVPITIDGNPADWAPVLSNPLQVTKDGEMCITGTTDRDCRTPSGGRDLDTFAWTWDSLKVYLYLTRFGSSANQLTFFFFMDTDGNQRMNSGEKVLAVDYKGTQDVITGTLWTYSALDPVNGDPMVNPTTGYADGYSIAGGSLINPVTLYDGKTVPPVRGGFLSSGTGFEAYVLWTDLGVPTGTPIYYHVSSSNGSSGAIIDNLGGPDGKIGAFAYYGVSISSAAPQTIAPSAASSQTVLYSHTLTNTGTLPDSYTLKAVSSAGFQVELLDSSGLNVLATDYTGDGVWESGSGALPPSGTLAAASGYPFYIRLTIPAGTDNLQDVTTLTATSNTQSCATVTAHDTTTVGTITLLPSPQAKSAMPTGYADYTLTLYNGGPSGTLQLTAVSSLGYTVQFLSGTSVTLAHGGSATVTVRVNIPSLAVPANGTGPVDTTTVTAQGQGSSALAVLTTTARNQLTLTPSYTVAANTNKYSGPSSAVAFAHTLINGGTGTFAVNSTSLTAVSSHGWTVLVYTDPNGDGNPSDGQLIDSSYSSTLAAFGGTLHLVAEVIVPAIATNLFPVTDTTTVTASGSGASTTASDQVVISYLAIFKDANHTLANRYFVPCDTIYALGGSLVADTTTRYQIRFKNPGGTYPYQPVVPSDGNGQASASYTLPSGSSGTWTAELYDGATKLDSVLVYVEPLSGSSTITGVATGQASYALSGDNLSISATFNNANTQATYSGTTFRYLVRNDATTSYLVPNTSGGASSFATYTAGTGQYTLTTSPHDIAAGASATETASISNVNFTPGGTYRIDVDWVGPCGNVIATATTVYFPVGTSLASYDGLNVPTEYFATGSTVYLKGAFYLNSTSYQVAYYDANGQLVSSPQSVSSGPTGDLSTTVAASSFGPFGTCHAVVYPAALTPPAVYNASDPQAVSQVAFVITPAAPTVSGPINAGAGSISGTSSAPADTTITVYSDGLAIGQTTVQAGGTWTLTGVTGLVGGESITAKAGPGTALSNPSSPVVVTPTAPVITPAPIAGEMSVSGTSTAPTGSTVTVTIGGTPYTSTVQPGGTWSVAVPALVAGTTVYATVTANGQTSAQSSATVLAPPINLLRYGGVTAINPLSPSATMIFTGYPGDPSLNPSQDLEVSGFTSGASFPHNASDLSNTPPLVFYQLQGNSGSTLRVAKSGGAIVISY